MVKENDVSSFSQLPLIGSLSNLQVMRTGIKARMSSNLSQIGLFNLELFALEHRFFSPIDLQWEKGKTMDFSETIVIYDLKLTTDDRRDKKFLLTSKLCPLEAVCTLPQGYIHVLSHEKKIV